MADELLRSRHAFGSLDKVESVLAEGKIDNYDILFIDGETDPKIGWIDKNGVFRLVDTELIITVKDESLPETGVEGKFYIHNEEAYFWNGEKYVPLNKSEDLSLLEEEIAKKVDAEEVESMIASAIAETCTVIEF